LPKEKSRISNYLIVKSLQKKNARIAYAMKMPVFADYCTVLKKIPGNVAGTG
jgi:hypothetical protein